MGPNKDLPKQVKELRKEIELLKKERNFYERLANSARDWIYLIDNKNNIIYVSPSCEKFTGYKQEEFYSNKNLLSKIIHPDDIVQFNNHKEHIDKSGNRNPTEFRIITKDNKEVWIGHVCQNVFDDNGEIIGIRVSNRDISEKKSMELELKESENLLRTAQSLSKLGNWELDLSTHKLRCSDELCNIFEIDIDTIENKNLTFLNTVHPEDKDILNNSFKKSLKSKSNYYIEYRLLMEDGRIKYLLENRETVFDDKGIPTYIRGTIQDITDKKKAELKLFQSEQQLQHIFDNSPSVMMLLNANRDIVKINKAGLELADVRLEDIQHKRGGDIFRCIYALNNESGCGYSDECSNCKIKQTMIDTITTQKPHIQIECEFTSIKKNQTIKRILLVSTIFIKEATAPSLLVLFDDITEKKKSDEKVKMLSKIVEQSPSTIVITDLNGNIEYANPSFEKITGYSLDEAMGKNPKILKSGKTSSEVFSELWQTISKGHVWNGEFINRKKQGEEYYEKAIISPFLNDKGEVENYFAIKNDITKQTLAEQALKESEVKFKTTFDILEVGLVITDENGFIINCNNASAEMLGLSQKECLKQNCIEKKWNIIRPDYSIMPTEEFAGIRALKENKTILNVEMGIIKKDNIITWMTVSATPLDLPGYGVVITCVNNTDLKEKEKLLIDSNLTKDKLFSIIAHDLRNPFNIILNISKSLKTLIENKSNEDLEEYVELLYRSAEKSYGLLVQLLEWSRAQIGNIEYKPIIIDLTNIIEDVSNLISEIFREKNIKIEIDLKEGTKVFADENMISTVFRNLLSNAAKYSHHNGEINISITCDNDENIICIKDNGVGIEKDNIEKLFKLDSSISTEGTNKEKGTGLGLLICKDFIEKHNGRLWVTSEIGNGSSFYFSIPDIIKNSD